MVRILEFVSIITGITVAATSVNQTNVCLSAGCAKAASIVLKYVDSTVDPCDDFYQFACGNFLKSTTIPEDQSSVSSFTDLTDKVLNQLRTIIDDPIRYTEPKPVRLIKKLYKSCMNHTMIEKNGLALIQEILARSGGWPVLEGTNWDHTIFNWRQPMYTLNRFGYVDCTKYLVPLSVESDYKNPGRKVIWVTLPSFGLRRELIIQGLSSKWVTDYYEYMVDVAVLFGADRKRATEELKDSVNFEIELAKITPSNDKLRNMNALYNPRTIGDLEWQLPTIPWLKYVKKILHPKPKVTVNDVLFIEVPEYLSDFENLIVTTPKRVQANYIMWRTVHTSIPYLTEALRNRKLKYDTTLTGRTRREPRWKECIRGSVTSLPKVANVLYLNTFYNKQVRDAGLEIMANIRARFEEILGNATRIDDHTRESAVDKIRSMTIDIPHPDKTNDEKSLKRYNNLILHDDYLASVLKLAKFNAESSLLLLRTVNTTLVDTTPYFVNAVYVLPRNTIHLGSGILQGQVFGGNRPRYMNYASLGFLLGHEMTHGFDDIGRQFDKNGKLSDWWKPQTEKSYLEKVQCVIDQYGNYTLREINITLNGVSTQGENIADNGAIKQAYLAYNKWSERHEVEKQLPGLDYTPNQMFWISAANIWCQKVRPEVSTLLSLVDRHSPNYFRVIGPFKNSEYFAKDFSCPLGSKMNPEKKCKVW